MNLIPLFPLNVVLYPAGPLPLRIFETRYLDMVRRCLREAQGFGVVLSRGGTDTVAAETAEVGTLAHIVDFDQLPDGLLGLSCVGNERFRILNRRRQADGLNLGEVDWLPPDPPVGVPERHAELAALLRTVLPQLGAIYAGLEMHFDDAAWVGNRLAEILPLAASDKQHCLELTDPVRRLDVLAPLIRVAHRSDAPGEPGASSAAH